MKYWIVSSTGIAGAQIDGIFSSASLALAACTSDSHVAVEMELDKNYANVDRFIVFTRDKPQPKMIDFATVLENRPVQ